MYNYRYNDAMKNHHIAANYESARHLGALNAMKGQPLSHLIKQTRKKLPWFKVNKDYSPERGLNH